MEETAAAVVEGESRCQEGLSILHTVSGHTHFWVQDHKAGIHTVMAGPKDHWLLATSLKGTPIYFVALLPQGKRATCPPESCTAADINRKYLVPWGAELPTVMVSMSPQSPSPGT